MAHSLNETFKTCYVDSASVPCQDIFVQVKTDAGTNNKFIIYVHVSLLPKSSWVSLWLINSLNQFKLIVKA